MPQRRERLCPFRNRRESMRLFTRLNSARDGLGLCSVSVRPRPPPPRHDILVSARVRLRRQGPRVVPGEVRIPWRHLQRPALRRRRVDEGPQVGVQISGEVRRRVQVNLHTRLRIRHPGDLEDLLAHPFRGVPWVLPELQMARGNREAFPVPLAAAGVEPRASPSSSSVVLCAGHPRARTRSGMPIASAGRGDMWTPGLVDAPAAGAMCPARDKSSAG